MKNNKAIAGLALSMLIFGTVGVFRRYIPFSSGLVAMARGLVGAVCLIAVILISKKGFDYRSVKKNLPLLILSGAALGFNWIFLFEAYNHTTVATATLCYYLAPVFVTLASPLVLREKLTAKKFVCVAVSLLGMVAVSGVLNSDGISGSDGKGILFGLCAAIFYATLVILNKKIKGIGAYEKTVVQLLSAAVILLPYVIFAEDVQNVRFDLTSLSMLLLCGILHTGVAYWLYFGSMDRLEAQTVAIFSYIDPVVAIILSATVLGENIGAWGYIGAALILGATLVSEINMPKKVKGEKE